MKCAVVLTVVISATVVAGLFALATFALTIFEEPKLDIVDRHSSPDAELEAIHVMPETGATDGFVDWIYVVKAGHAPSGKPIFVADKVDGGIAIGWSSNAEITVSAKSARIFRSEPATVSLPGSKTREVTIRLDIADIRRP
jgi:hypothetical protein